MSYKPTVRACYLGTICQAVNVNLTALLFTALGVQFGLSYTQLGGLVLVNFITQVAVAVIFGNVVDRVGFRIFIVGAHIAAAVGMGWFAATPWLPFDPYVMLLFGTFIIGASGGFMEILLSPILNAIPTDEKSSAMSIMHGFFCFGHAGMAAGTALFLTVFGRESWPFVVMFWTILPLGNAILFATCPIAPAVPITSQSSAKDGFRKPLLLVLLAMIAFAGASELTFSQWTSAFMEEGMGLPKLVGDIAGVGTFALAMGVGRVGYGVLKQKGIKWMPEQHQLMFMGCIAAAASYVIVALTHNPVIGLLACALCGLGVSLLWPGTISLSVKAFPLAGTWMFAAMAAGGNIGGSVGPVAFGMIADHAYHEGLRTAFMMTAVIPLGAALVMLLYMKLRRTNRL